MLYDVTTLYFEAEKEDGLRKVGYSKERRVDPQIVVGLLVDRTGFPLEIGCFEGNKAETLTIVPIVKAFAARHGIEGMVVVADAGMLSATNLRELDAAGLGFIVGSRQTTAPLDLAAPLPLARGGVHRRAGHRHDHPQAPTSPPRERPERARPNRSGPTRPTRARGGRSGPTPASGSPATTAP